MAARGVLGQTVTPSRTTLHARAVTQHLPRQGHEGAAPAHATVMVGRTSPATHCHRPRPPLSCPAPADPLQPQRLPLCTTHHLQLSSPLRSFLIPIVSFTHSYCSVTSLLPTESFRPFQILRHPYHILFCIVVFPVPPSILSPPHFPLNPSQPFRSFLILTASFSVL